MLSLKEEILRKLYSNLTSCNSLISIFNNSNSSNFIFSLSFKILSNSPNNELGIQLMNSLIEAHEGNVELVRSSIDLASANFNSGVNQTSTEIRSYMLAEYYQGENVLTSASDSDQNMISEYSDSDESDSL